MIGVRGIGYVLWFFFWGEMWIFEWVVRESGDWGDCVFESGGYLICVC